MAKSQHDQGWEAGFIAPLVEFMLGRGIAELHVKIANGKAVYELLPEGGAEVKVEVGQSRCGHSEIADRGFIYPNYTCLQCGEEFGEEYPQDRKPLNHQL